MTTKKVYVACDGIEFYDEDKCRKYEDELDNLQVPNLSMTAMYPPLLNI